MSVHRACTVALAACLLSFATLPSVADPAETPDAFVRRIYARYRAHGPDVSTSRPEGMPFDAPALLDLFAHDEAQAKGEVGAIDGDPLCGCQDHDAILVKSITVSPQGADMVLAQVAFRTLGKAGAVKLTLLRTPQGWRIADVGDKNTASIVALLKDSIAHSSQNPAPPKP